MMLDQWTANARWYFVAMRYYRLILNRIFVVFVTDQFLAGARVRGLLSAPNYATGDLQRPEFYINPVLISRYYGMDITSGQFLDEDGANFRVSRADIERVDYHRKKWGMGTVPYSGRLVIRTVDRKAHELILVGQQDAEQILDRLQRTS